MKNLYIIFVNFNSGDQLLNGVKSVLRSKTVSGIIIVDNDSRDGSLKKIEEIAKNKNIHILKNKENLGFYNALNIAVKKAIKLKADAVMPLDFDLDFSFDFISKLAKVDSDMVVPVLKSKYNDNWFYDYGGRINFKTSDGSHNLKTKKLKLNKPIYTNVGKEDPNWIDYVSGGCTIIKMTVFKEIGLFNEKYFVYWGDTEFALRARRNGFKVAVDPSTVVYHKLEIATQTKNFHKLKISFMDNVRFINNEIKKYYRPFSYLFIFILMLKVLFNKRKLVKEN